jgi:thioredoxin reductase
VRRIAREQLAKYPRVEVRDAYVESITGTRGAFRATVTGGVVEARRVLLCTGMIDEMPPIDGFGELWGKSIFQCPYCHGWEVQERKWGYLARASEPGHLVPFCGMARGWTRDVVAFTNDAFEVPAEDRERLRAAGVRLETAPVKRLVAREGGLEAVELSDGKVVPCEAMFTHPPQRQVDLVRSLNLELDEAGYVRVDPMSYATSIPGIHAAGDLTTRIQGAVLSAAAASRAAAGINVELTMDLAVSGAI